MNKILFVDDEESIRLLYDDEFTEEGYHVITATGDENLLTNPRQKKYTRKARRQFCPIYSGRKWNLVLRM